MEYQFEAFSKLPMALVQRVEQISRRNWLGDLAEMSPLMLGHQRVTFQLSNHGVLRDSSLDMPQCVKIVGGGKQGLSRDNIFNSSSTAHIGDARRREFGTSDGERTGVADHISDEHGARERHPDDNQVVPLLQRRQAVEEVAVDFASVCHLDAAAQRQNSGLEVDAQLAVGLAQYRNR